MIDYLLGLLIRWPSLWRAVGSGLATTAIAMIALGLRLGRRLDRVEQASSRVGVAVDIHLGKLLPSWLSLVIPETTAGFATWFAIGFFGVVLAITAKRIKKLYY